MGQQTRPQTVPGVHVATVRDFGRLLRIWAHAQWRIIRSARPVRVMFLIAASTIAALTVPLVALAGLDGVLQVALWLGIAAVAGVLIAAVYTLFAIVDPRSTLFISDDGTSTVLLKVSPTSWHILDHMAGPTGAGHGQRLRAQLGPALLDQADRAGVTITFGARPDMARLYRAAAHGFTCERKISRGSLYARAPRP
ncbi:hypothetical protein [Oerskovia enterophila]|uniref:hypothetical protein n=1 Tax=Oerskovia enterophila TaxID=43678 RepID=UPI001111EAE8|nr:hypothetical protein [Oerskovia enterophila]